MDGSGRPKILLLAFDRAVTITHILFDNFDMEFDQDDAWVRPDATGSFFGVATRDEYDDFRIRAVALEVAPVLPPAARPLLFAGLGGLAVVARRNKKT